MRTTRFAAAGALGLAAALTFTACSGNAGATGADSGPQPVPTTDGSGKTLTVWVMEGDYQDATLEAINDAFTEQTGADVDLQIQQWDGITTKVSTALATATPPDIIDIGNTQVPGYAANGGLLDLTSYEDDLMQGATWLTGLEEPSRIDGSLYAVPGFAGTRAVIYNAKMWADAGVTEIPTTYEELTAALDAVAAAHTEADFSPFYFPGQYWQSSMQFVWDAGAEIATSDDGTWTGGFSTPEGIAGLEQFAEFQNTYSTGASATLDNITPDQNQIFADGKTSAILNTGGGIAGIKKANPEITDDMLGTFPLPGLSGDQQPAMLGGSVWGIAAKTQNHDLALQWAKIAGSPEIQEDYVYGVDGWIPNSVEGIEAAQADGLSPLQAGFFQAALVSKATPGAANWPTIEGDKSIAELFGAIASGAKTAEEAAEEFDAHLADVLND
ncbi:N,N'-diacetylchitobiose transport system substrate-binding protein [Agromyces sp. CF514]|uniref:extracellular solute-binding protein n=1 Tax=Agromyces sp. CF514 TaxID=1881031 RepID=UPI0008F399E5|nr:extracellular solute-binding protein [Agromyces sp. CF514]SFR82769.1 N,N'-diacetylchitobiose transport system substrate-binding protein [Agromyces sp. CF514]